MCADTSLYIRDRQAVNIHVRTKKNAEEYTNLVEVDAFQGVLYVRFERVPRSCERNVGLVGQAAAAGEQGDDSTLSIKNDGTRVAALGEGSAPAVGHNGGLEGGKGDIVEVVVADEGLEPIKPADGGAGGQAVLDYGHGEAAAAVALRGLAHFALGYDVEDWKQAVLRVRVASAVGSPGVH